MNTIIGICGECGKRLAIRGNRLCHSCQVKYRICDICGKWDNQERMIPDVKRKGMVYRGWEYFGWVCSKCYNVTRKATK